MIRRTYKDTVFRDLFGSPERRDYALSLYNTLNGTDYRDPGGLRAARAARAGQPGRRHAVRRGGRRGRANVHR